MSLSTAPARAHFHCLAFADACAGRWQADVHDVHMKVIVRPAHGSGNTIAATDVVRLVDNMPRMLMRS